MLFFVLFSCFLCFLVFSRDHLGLPTHHFWQKLSKVAFWTLLTSFDHFLLKVTSGQA